MKFSPKKTSFLLLGFIFLTLLLTIEKNVILTSIGNFLVVKSVLKPTDAIVVLSGDEYERVRHALHLYQKGFAKYIIMSGGTLKTNSSIEAQKMKEQAVEWGVPPENIILEPQSLHTYEHPLFVKPILDEHNFHTAIIVSSPYHMKRVSMIFNQEFKNTDIQLLYSPVEHSWFHPDTWWQNKTATRVVLLEYLKMTVNIFGSKANEYLYNFFGVD